MGTQHNGTLEVVPVTHLRVVHIIRIDIRHLMQHSQHECPRPGPEVDHSSQVLRIIRRPLLPVVPLVHLSHRKPTNG